MTKRFKPFLRLLCFPDAEMEKQYRNHQKCTVKFFACFWCFVAACMIGVLRFEYRALHVPVTLSALPFGVILLVFALNWVRYMERHMLQLLSLSTALIVVWVSWSTAVHIDARLSSFKAHSMHSVWEALDGHIDAKHQLEAALGDMTTDHIMCEHVYILLGLLGSMVLTGAGVCTILTILSTPALFFGTLAGLGSNYSALYVLRLCVMMCFCIIINLGATFFRRAHFEDRHTFENTLEKNLANHRMADSILNHTLKNTMAGAAGCIELFMAQVCLQRSRTAARRYSW